MPIDANIIKEIISKAEAKFQVTEKGSKSKEFNLLDILTVYEDVLIKHRNHHYHSIQHHHSLGIDASTDTQYYKFLLDLSVEINRKGRQSWHKTLSKLIHRYERNAYVMKHYFNVLLSKSFYLLFKNAKDQQLRRTSHQSQVKSRNNDIDECNNVRRNLNFSSKQLDESSAIHQESKLQLESKISKLLRSQDHEVSKDPIRQNKELPKFLQPDENQSDTYYKSHIFENAQHSENTKLSAKSKSNLSAIPQSQGLSSSMLDNSFNGDFINIWQLYSFE